VSADYQVEVGVGVGREAGGSWRKEGWRWIEDPRPEWARRITSLWIGPHNESPPRGRSAIEWLLERARGTLLLNIREKFENGKPRGTHLLNNFWGSPACWRARARGEKKDSPGWRGPLSGVRRGEGDRLEVLGFLGDNTRGTHGRTGSVGVNYWGGNLRKKWNWLPVVDTFRTLVACPPPAISTRQDILSARAPSFGG